jgi:integrase/recombinase XerD
LANAGINVRLLAELAGHKHISTTQRYIDVNDTQLAYAVEQAAVTRFPSQLRGSGGAGK